MQSLEGDKDQERNSSKHDSSNRPQSNIPPKRMKMHHGGDVETQPPMMTFKAFLNSQDDNITDEEASAKYTEYKQDFRRQQLNDFFKTHKDEEWFRLKYHPEESVKRKEELKSLVNKRSALFFEMMEKGYFDEISLEIEKSEAIERLLDQFVIMLEEEKTPTITDQKVSEAPKKNKEDYKKIEDIIKESRKAKKHKRSGSIDERNVEEDKDYDWIVIDDVGGDDDDDDASKGDSSKVDPANQRDNENGLSEEKSTLERCEKDVSPTKDEQASKAKKDKESHHNSQQNVSNEQPHKTRSLFIRSISPRVTKSDIEEVCKNYPGFLRVWMSDAQLEQPWCRRGFITFKRDVNIKQICWNLNNIKIKECELQPTVNSDLSVRVKPVNGITNHKQVILSDLKLATKVIQELDSKYDLWKCTEAADGPETGNLIFKGITDYLVEEVPAEAEELLGQYAIVDEYNVHTAERVKVLDKLLLYLRLVHSVDYYYATQYISEDEMPNKCRIIHVRGELQATREFSSNEIQEYIDMHAEKLKPLLAPVLEVPQTDLYALGFKEKETEVEKFIQANTQELAKDKWLCPLSGKKFKAPEFVRKHILNKFNHELEFLLKEANYFNNYLKDPKRPELPDHPGIPMIRRELEVPFPYHFGGGFRRGFGYFGGHGFYGRGRGGPMRGRMMDYRPVITYRDLDAPNEPDEVV